MSASEYDRIVEFLAAGFLVRDRMTPEVLEHWRAELHRAIGLRGGLVSDHVDIAVGKEVMAEVAERAMRLFANELSPELHKRMDDDAVAAVETELSDTLQRVLAYIEAAKL
jgi:hypothetical protein